MPPERRLATPAGSRPGARAAARAVRAEWGLRALVDRAGRSLGCMTATPRSGGEHGTHDAWWSGGSDADGDDGVARPRHGRAGQRIPVFRLPRRGHDRRATRARRRREQRREAALAPVAGLLVDPRRPGRRPRRRRPAARRRRRDGAARLVPRGDEAPAGGLPARGARAGPPRGDREPLEPEPARRRAPGRRRPRAAGAPPDAAGRVRPAGRRRLLRLAAAR